MEILGIGPLELLFILIIALIVIGPNDMAKTGRTIGRWLRKLVTSPTWLTVQHTTRELRKLPYTLMREAGIEEEEMKKIGQDIGLGSVQKDLKNDLKNMEADLSPWTTTPNTGSSILEEDTNPTIAPPTAPPAPSEPAPEDLLQSDDDGRN
jgi:sec-independent protein translocase protein TatB